MALLQSCSPTASPTQPLITRRVTEGSVNWGTALFTACALAVLLIFSLISHDGGVSLGRLTRQADLGSAVIEATNASHTSSASLRQVTTPLLLEQLQQAEQAGQQAATQAAALQQQLEDSKQRFAALEDKVRQAEAVMAEQQSKATALLERVASLEAAARQAAESTAEQQAATQQAEAQLKEEMAAVQQQLDALKGQLAAVQGMIEQQAAGGPAPSMLQQELQGAVIPTASPIPGSLEQYHVVMSAGSNIYMEWQSRVAYYWYKKAKAADEQGVMGGFTRLLTGTEFDAYADEIPTVLADPLPPELAAIANGYAPLDRPYAFQQWAHKHLPLLPEKYVFMMEPDHILLQPLPLLATPTKSVGFAFDYMQAQESAGLINSKFNPRNISIDHFYPSGSSPTIIHRHFFTELCDLWVHYGFKIRADQEADQAWGWVQEMYAFIIAAANMEDGPMKFEMRQDLMAQPPVDATILHKPEGTNVSLIHYTWGSECNGNLQWRKIPDGSGVWHWEKRDFLAHYPPKEYPLPPSPGCDNHEVVREVVTRVNEAARTFSDWDAKVAAPQPAPQADPQPARRLLRNAAK